MFIDFELFNIIGSRFDSTHFVQYIFYILIQNMFSWILSTKRSTLKELRIARIKKIKKTPEWPLVSAFMVNEMKPVIEFIINSKSESIVVEVCKKYFIIACVSLMEEFLIRLARRTIDDKKIDISVFGNEISKILEQRNKERDSWRICGSI